MVDKELRIITSRLAESLNPEKIYLFGSFARNEENNESDYDIYIMLRDDDDGIKGAYLKAYKSVRGYRTRPIDFIIGTVSGFENRKKLPLIERTIANEGVLLYDRSGYSSK